MLQLNRICSIDWGDIFDMSPTVTNAPPLHHLVPVDVCPPAVHTKIEKKMQSVLKIGLVEV